jgi:hypothetical protein
MKIVVINGKGGCGKDTFVSCCREIINKNRGKCQTSRCLNISTVDYVKYVAAFCGWEGEKDPATRKFLSQLKDILTEWKDIPFQDIKQKINEYKKELSAVDNFIRGESVVFIHCREPKEIARLVEEFNAKTLLIRRDVAEKVEQFNHADNCVLNYVYDYTVYNNDTLDALRAAAEVFLREFLGLDI